jgi:hypothetical protein
VEHWLFGLGSCPGWLVRPSGAFGCQARNARSQGLRRPSTLLGPEGTAAGLVTSVGPTLPRHAAMEGVYRPYLENCTVDASIICSCQVNKGTRWMPWYQEPKKDVGACDKPRGVGNQT